MFMYSLEIDLTTLNNKENLIFPFEHLWVDPVEYYFWFRG